MLRTQQVKALSNTLDRVMTTLTFGGNLKAKPAYATVGGNAYSAEECDYDNSLTIRRRRRLRRAAKRPTNYL